MSLCEGLEGFSFSGWENCLKTSLSSCWNVRTGEFVQDMMGQWSAAGIVTEKASTFCRWLVFAVSTKTKCQQWIFRCCIIDKCFCLYRFLPALHF